MSCDAIHYHTMLYCTVPYSSVRYNTVPDSAMLYTTIQYSAQCSAQLNIIHQLEEAAARVQIMQLSDVVWLLVQYPTSHTTVQPGWTDISTFSHAAHGHSRRGLGEGMGLLPLKIWDIFIFRTNHSLTSAAPCSLESPALGNRRPASEFIIGKVTTI